MNVITAQLGGHVAIQLTSREIRPDNLDGQRFDVNGIIFTQIVDPTGAALASGSIPTWHIAAKGRYVCHLDTSGLSEGDYECEIEVGVAFSSQSLTTERKARKDFILRLVDHGVP